MAYQARLFETGPIQDGSNVSECLEVNASIPSKESSLYLEKMTSPGGNHTSMLESAATTKKETLNVKSKTSKKRTLDTNLSKTLVQESTSKEKDLKPFWNESSPGWSAKLWSCIATGLQELDSNCWSSSLKRLARNSWFTVRQVTSGKENLLKTSLQSQPTLSPHIMDAVLQKIENEERKLKTIKRQKTATDKKELRTRRVRFYPTPEQRLGLKSWFGAVRFCYNQFVAKYRVVGLGGVKLKTLRGVTKQAEETNPWLKEIRHEVKDSAVRDFDKAREAHFAKHKGVKTKATFKFRSKKDPQQSIEVRARDMDRGSGAFFFIRFDSLKFGKNEKSKLPEKLEHSIRIIRDRHNRYFLSIPYDAETKDTSTKNPQSVVALDPGVRTFQTTYDNLGYATEWGKGDMTQLFRLCLFADKLQSIWQKKKGSKRRSTKKAWLRALERIKNKRKEVHCKMTTWLCQEYKVILIPLFETSNMVKRGYRKIKSKTVRGMLTWSHYTFREMLKTKAQLYPGTKVVVCDEAYTSKTCGQCGSIHTTLGGSKTFKCKSCAYVGDRDISAARNILLRYLSL